MESYVVDSYDVSPGHNTNRIGYGGSQLSLFNRTVQDSAYKSLARKSQKNGAFKHV
jgi:hypothetical protein